MDREALIEEEIFIIQAEGEIPEVAFHNAVHHLCSAPGGPGLILAQKEFNALKQAVADRYRTIILRDLTPSNRDRSLYRGLERSAANWERLESFARREGFDLAVVREEVASVLLHFIHREAHDVATGRRACCVNCTADRLRALVMALPLSMDQLPDNWERLCCPRETD